MIEKVCLYCKNKFETESSRKKYCSTNCCAYYNKKYKVKKCKNCNRDFESKNANKMHCSIECRSIYKREVLFVEDFNIYEEGFDSINSYIFGLIISDGSLVFDKHSNRDRIVISSNDIDMLERIRGYCRIDRKIYCNGNNGYTLVYINQKAVNFLERYGLEYRKSKTKLLHIIPNDMMSHFIRGYFDGNGSITTNRNKYGVYQQVKFTIGSELFSKSLNEYFLNMNYSSNVYVDKKDCYYVIISKTIQIAQFYNYLYNDCGYWYFERKKSKFIYK